MLPSPSRRWSEPSPQVRLWALAIAGLLLLWVTIAARVNHEELRAVREGPATSEALANAYAQQLEDLLDQSDQLLLALAALRRRGASADEMEQVIRQLPSHSWQRPYYVDASGLVRSSAEARSRGMQVARQPFFSTHLHDADDGLHIHPAAPGIGAMAGESVVRLTRRVSLPDGGFGGVIVLPIPIRVFEPLHESPNDLPHDLAIASLVGGPFITSSQRPLPAWQSRTRPGDYRAVVAAASLNDAEHLLRQSARDVSARMRLARHDVEVLVAVNRNTLLAPLERERADLNLLGLVASFVVLVLASWASWRLVRRSAEQERSRHAWSVFRQAVDESNDEFFMLTPLPGPSGTTGDFRLDDCNARAMQALGLARERVIGQVLSTLVPPADWAWTRDFLARACDEGYAETEARFSGRVPNRQRWVHCRVSRVEDSLAVVVRDVSELKEKERQLRKLALTDGLTGLPNRHWVNQRLPAVLQGAASARQYVAALFIDLDNFKIINDTLGHKVGDEYLRTAAAAIQQVVRETDIVVRLGGDEFLVLALQLEDLQLAHTVATNIIERIREVGQGGRWSSAQPRASIGIAAFPLDARNAGDLVQAADIAMYEAKRLGKDRFEIYVPSMRDRLLEDHFLETELRNAIGHAQFELRLLPRASVATGRLAGFEALLRWNHPTLGPIAPARFIPIAEKHQLIGDLGCWVVDEVCQLLANWRQLGKPTYPVSINLAAQQLRTPRLRNHLALMTERHRLDPALVEIELTEAVLVAADPLIKNELKLLRELGKLIIDDFGTAYSSLVQMQDLRVDMLKIDTSVVSNLSAGIEGAQICRAMVQIGKTLGVEVLAEGVEKREQFDKLLQFGCDEVQGYLVAEPLLAAEAIEIMSRRELIDAAAPSPDNRPPSLGNLAAGGAD